MLFKKSVWILKITIILAGTGMKRAVYKINAFVRYRYVSCTVEIIQCEKVTVEILTINIYNLVIIIIVLLYGNNNINITWTAVWAMNTLVLS